MSIPRTKIGWLALLGCLTATSGYATVYKQEMHTPGEAPEFSDQAQPNSTPLEVAPLQTFTLPKSTPTPAQPNAHSPREITAPTYSIVVLSPASGAQLDPSEWMEVTASATPQPTAQEGFQLIQDGSPVTGPQSDPTFKIHWLPRGEHHFKVQLVDRLGKVLAESAEITCYQKRPIGKAGS